MAKSNKSKKDNKEAVGIIIFIVSVFFLMCLIYPEILSIFGVAIYKATTGILGVFSYAFFLITLIYGIFILKNYRLNVSKKRLTYIILISIFSLLILHMITVNDLYSLPFNQFISSNYDFNNNISMGGVLFGLFTYAVKGVISLLGAYIFFCILFLSFSALLISDIISYKKPIKQSKRKYSFAKGTKPDVAPIKPIPSSELFIEKIIKKDRHNEEGTFSQFNQQPKKAERSFDDFFKSIKESKEKEEQEESNVAAAKSILFANKKKMTEDSASRFINSKNIEKEIKSVELPKIISSPPDLKTDEEENPLKKSTKGLPEIVFPPVKERVERRVVGEIINGEEYSNFIKSDETKKPFFNKFDILKNNDIINCEENDIINCEDEEIQEIYSTKAPEKVDDNIYEKDEDGNLIIYKKDILPKDIKKINEDINEEKDKNVEHDEIEQISVGEEFKSVPFSSQEIINADEQEILEELNSENEIEITDDSIKIKSEQEILEELNQEQTQEDELNQEQTQEDELNQEEIQEDEPNQEEIQQNQIKSEQVHKEEKESKPDYTGYYERENKLSPFLQKLQEFENKIESKNQISIESYLKDSTPKPKKRKQYDYNYPPLSLLVSKSTDPEEYGQDFQANAAMLEETLKNLKLPAKVIGITRGPAVTRYELEMPLGTTVKKIEGFSQDISYALASPRDVRIEAPIPGKRAVGVEVANAKIGIVALKDLIESQEFLKSTSPLTMCVGKDVAGKIVLCNLDKMPHLLIAGSTNSGKSACLHSLITSILYKSSPQEVRFVLIDPKRVEFLCYLDLPHLLINQIINEKSQAVNAFKWLYEETENRYKLLAECKCRSISEYNVCDAVRNKEKEKLHSIVIVVDELADLMLGEHKKEIEEYILCISQKARAAGVHLILATQRPSVDVLTGTIKVNLPSRIALAVANGIDSKTILDRSGAEMLLGRGDLLYAPVDSPDPKRVQGAYVSKEEVEAIVDYIKENNESDFYLDAQSAITKVNETTTSESEQNDNQTNEFDILLEDVVRRVMETNQVSSSMLQRRFGLGYSRASRIIDQMERLNFVGPMVANKTKPREIYITKEMFKEFFGKDF